MDAPWTAWGETRPELSRRARALLRSELGATTPLPETPVEAVRPAPSALPEAARLELEKALGDAAVAADDVSRARHAGGQAYGDIVRRRRGDTSQAPDAVVTPSNA